MNTLVSNNTTIKISSAVSATVSVVNTTSTLYTCPSNSYAILNIYVNSAAANSSVNVDGKIVAILNGSGISPSIGGAFSSSGFTIYVGPSQVVSITSGAVATVLANATGVCFTNTP